VASASADGAPYPVPLSFDWDGEALLVATPTDSPTGRNLATTRTVRLYRWFRISPRRLQAWREVNELADRELMRDGRWWTDASGGRAAWPGPRGSTGRGEGEPDVLLDSGQIEPGDADGDRESGPA
jgi:hypothetical protein